MVDDSERSESTEPEHDADKRRIAERLLPELIKRIVEVGVGKIADGPENLRHFVSELRLPKEIASYVLAQIDETKNGLYRVVAKEIREFLDSTNLSEELTRALTKLSFQIKTEIRFVPNESDSNALPRPEVRAEVALDKDKSSEPKKEERPKKHSP